MLVCTITSSFYILPAQIFGGAKKVNVSHVIHDLSFGPKYPGIHNPLDGTARILDDTSGTFKYYIKVVSALSSNCRIVLRCFFFLTSEAFLISH